MAAPFLGRLFKGQGHEVRLMSPEHVQPYVKAQNWSPGDGQCRGLARSSVPALAVDTPSGRGGRFLALVLWNDQPGEVASLTTP